MIRLLVAMVGMLMMVAVSLSAQNAPPTPAAIEDMEWSADGMILATAGFDIRTFDRALMPVTTYDTELFRYSDVVSWHPTESLFITNRRDTNDLLGSPTTLRVYNAVMETQTLEVIYTSEFMSDLAVNIPDLAWATPDGIFVPSNRNARVNRITRETLEFGDSFPISAVDGQRIGLFFEIFAYDEGAYVAFENIIRRPQPGDVPVVRLIEIETSEIRDIAFAENFRIEDIYASSGLLAVELTDHDTNALTLAFYDLATDEIICELLTDLTETANSDVDGLVEQGIMAYLSSDGVNGEGNWTVTIVDIFACEVMTTFAGDDSLYRMAWNPQGTPLVIADTSGALQTLDIDALLGESEAGE